MATASSGHGWRIGSLSGIPIYLGRSWVLVAGVIVVLFGPTVQNLMPGLGIGAYAVALAFAVLLLMSVLAHEAAHGLVAQRVGFTVSRIVADFWGGHTAHDGAGGTPGTSAAVAVVGPLANGVLAVLGWGLLQTGDWRGVPFLLVYAFTAANAFVAIFNLVPGLPLDGGFLLESLVWKLTGNRHRGTLAAGWAGRIVVLLLLLWVLRPVVLQGQRVDLSSFLWVALIGGFLWQGASRAVRAGRLGLTTSRQQLGDVAREIGVVDTDTLLSGIAWDSRPLWIVLDHAGAPEGIVDPASLHSVPAHAWSSTSASSVAVRLAPGWATALAPEASVDQGLEVMRRTGSGIIGLLDVDGRPWGALLIDDVTTRRGTPTRS